MASYHCSIKNPLSRAKGKSLMEKAAYNARTQYRDERTGQLTQDYSGRGGLLESYLAHGSKLTLPDWVKADRQRLLNAAVAAEKRKDSREGQEIVFGFIDELGLQKSQWMLNDFVRENFTRGTGRLALIDIHDAPDHGDIRNQHAHVILLRREILPDGSFGELLPALEPKDYDHIREKWAEKGAKELRKEAKKSRGAGDERRAEALELQADRYQWGHLQLRHDPDDRRTWNGNNQRDKALERGDPDWAKHCDREAEKHRGPAADAMERKGQETDRGKKPEPIQQQQVRLARELTQPFAPIWDRDAANRDWENAVINAAIENGNTGGGREKTKDAQRQQHSALPAELTGPAQHIREARERSDNAPAFTAALFEHGIGLAQATRDDAAQSQLDSAEASIAGYWKPAFREGEVVAVTDQGQVWKLTPRTTGEKNDRDIQNFLGGLTAPLPSIEDARRDREEQRRLRSMEADIDLGKTAGSIRLAYNLSDSPLAFKAALEQDGLTAARVVWQDIHKRDNGSKQENGLSDHAREGDVVVLDKWGKVYELNRRTTGDTRRDAQAVVAGIGDLPSIDEAHRELEERRRKPIHTPAGPQHGGLVAHQMWALRNIQRRHEEERRDQDRWFREQTGKKSNGEVDPARYLTDPDYRREVRTSQSFKTLQEKKTEKENDLRALMEQQDRQR